MILAEQGAKELLGHKGIPVIPVQSVPSLEAAQTQAQAMGFPVVLKLSSARHSHKTEVGGVRLNLRNAAELESAFGDLARLREALDPAAAIIVEPMAAAAAEFFVGVQRHPDFGWVMTFGLGGIWLELMQDVSFRLLPASRKDFQEMLDELRSWPQLRKGFRHLPAVGVESLLDLMQLVAAFALEYPGLEEMDLNPVMAYADRALVVDARMVLSD
jgi:succinyl-CoA synthetase beta subunit